MLCARCKSNNVRQRQDCILCTECGFTKKVLQVAEQQFQTGHAFKKRITFISQKTHQKNSLQSEQSTFKPTLADYLTAYQKCLKHACRSFMDALDVQQDVESEIRRLWFRFLDKWEQIGRSIESIFTRDFGEDMQEQQAQEEDDGGGDTKSIVIQQEEEINEMDDIVEDRERQEGQAQHNLMPRIDLQQLIMTQQKEESQKTPEPNNSKSLIKKLLRTLPIQKPELLFKELTKLDHWTQKLFNFAALTYLRKLYRNSPNSSEYMSTEWLQSQSHKRQIRKSFHTRPTLICLIFSYDLLLHSLQSQKPQTPPSLSRLITHFHSQPHPAPLTHLCLSISSKLLEARPRKQQPFKPQQPPYLDYKLIYSFIDLALRISKQAYYISEILEHAEVVVQYQQWMDVKMAKVGARPKSDRVRANSIRLSGFLGVNVPYVQRGWVDRVLGELELMQYQRHINIMLDQLKPSAYHPVYTQVYVLATLLLFLKLTIGLDNQPHLAFMPVGEVSRSGDGIDRAALKKIEMLQQRSAMIPQIKDKVQLNFRDLIEKIQNGKRPQVFDIEMIGVGELDQAIEQAQSYRLGHPLYEQKYRENSIKYSQMVRLTPPPCMQSQLVLSDQTPKTYPNHRLRNTVTNQLPRKLRFFDLSKSSQGALSRVISSLVPSQILLPSNNYQIIYDFKSIYRSLQRDELFLVLQGLSQRRCDVNTLWTIFEGLERTMLDYQQQ